MVSVQSVYSHSTVSLQSAYGQSQSVYGQFAVGTHVYAHVCTHLSAGPMTEQRYVANNTPDTPLTARWMLCDTIGLAEGFTGRRSAKEYLVPNCARDCIPLAQWVELETPRPIK